MKVQMVALCAFSGPDGNFAKGENFEVSRTRAAFLAEGGYAQALEPFDPPQTAVDVPEDLKATPQDADAAGQDSARAPAAIKVKK